MSLASDSVDPNKVYAAVGTYTNSWDPGNGAVLRSSDRGASWQKTDLPFKLGGNMPGRGMGERLAVDPNKNSVLYLGAPERQGPVAVHGLGRHLVAGDELPQRRQLRAGPVRHQRLRHRQPGHRLGHLRRVAPARRASATQTIYVGVADKDNAVYRSTDAGATWSRLAGQPTGYLAHKGVLDAENGYLYLPYSDKGGPYDGGKGQLWRYATGDRRPGRTSARSRRPTRTTASAG